MPRLSWRLKVLILGPAAYLAASAALGVLLAQVALHPLRGPAEECPARVLAFFAAHEPHRTKTGVMRQFGEMAAASSCCGNSTLIL